MIIGEVRWRRFWGSFPVRGLAALTVAILVLGSASAAAPSQDAMVRPDPVVSAVPLGGQVVVTIYVQDVQALYGADVRLGFDPAVLEVQDMNPAASGVQIAPLSTFLKPDFVVRNSACNGVDSACPIAGIIRYAVTQVNPSAPVSGSGALAAVTFTRLRSDATTLQIIAHKLSDRTGVKISAVAQEGRVELPMLYRHCLPFIQSGQ